MVEFPFLFGPMLGHFHTLSALWLIFVAVLSISKSRLSSPPDHACNHVLRLEAIETRDVALGVVAHMEQYQTPSFSPVNALSHRN